MGRWRRPWEQVALSTYDRRDVEGLWDTIKELVSVCVFVCFLGWLETNGLDGSNCNVERRMSVRLRRMVIMETVLAKTKWGDSSHFTKTFTSTKQRVTTVHGLTLKHSLCTDSVILPLSP